MSTIFTEALNFIEGAPKSSIEPQGGDVTFNAADRLASRRAKPVAAATVTKPKTP